MDGARRAADARATWLAATLVPNAWEGNLAANCLLLFSDDVLHSTSMDASFHGSLIGAVAVHVGIGTVLLLAAPPSWRVARRTDVVPIWIELERPASAGSGELAEPRQAANSAVPAGPPGEPARDIPSQPVRMPGVEASSTGTEGRVLHDGTVGEDGIGSLSPAVGASGGPKEDTSAAGKGPGRPRRPIDVGLGGGLHWAVVGPMPSAAAPRPLSPTGGLQEALDDHDRAAGLGFGGPAASALRSAANSISAPRVGGATVEMVFDGLGKVTSARVLSATGDMGGWSRVAAEAQALLASSRVRVPMSSRGMAVTLRVEARTQLPSGAVPGESPRVRPSGVGARGQFDLSDIGATPSRTVSVQITGERRL